MDFGYMMKRMFGVVSPEEEQAHRAELAAEDQRAYQAQQLRAAPVQVAPQVMPGNALSERQQLLDSALQNLQQQNGLRGAVNGSMPTTPSINPDNRPPHWIGTRG